MMIDYIELIWGSIFAVIISMIMGYFLGSLGAYGGYILVTIFVGYQVNEDLVNGALHGLMVGIIAGLFSSVMMLTMGVFIGMGPGTDILEFGLFGIVLGLLINGIVGASGGTLGSLIRINNFIF